MRGHEVLYVRACMYGGVYPQDNAYSRDKKLNCYVNGIWLSCTTIRQNIYTYPLLEISAYALEMALVIFMVYRLGALSILK